MIPYLICFAFPAIALLIPNRKIKNKKLLIGFLLLPFCLLMALKHESIGADTISYNIIYKNMCNGNVWDNDVYSRLEVGFKALIWLLSRISTNPQMQYYFLAGLFYITFIYFLYQNAEDYSLFILLFYGLNLFSFFLTGLRQSIAMLICFLGLNQAKKNHLIRFLIWNGVAFLFHKSAIIFLISYWCINKRFTKSDILIYFIVFAFIAIFNESIFNLGGELFDVNYGIEYVRNGYFMVAIVAVTTLLSFVFFRQLISNNKFNSSLIELNAVCMGIWILRLFSRTAERMALYFMPFTMLLICQLLGLFKVKGDKTVFSLGVIGLMGFLFIYRLNAIELIPYLFVWN